MMSYSFTDPEDDPEEEDGINLVEGEVEKPEPRRFMLPVGDLLNHTWDNNARIEFGDDCLTINAIKVTHPMTHSHDSYQFRILNQAVRYSIHLVTCQILVCYKCMVLQKIRIHMMTYICLMTSLIE